MDSTAFEASFKYKLIYIMRINDEMHRDILKIGDATVKTDVEESKLFPNCSILNKAAKERIKQYTNTAGIRYELLHTELAICKNINKSGELELKSFRDYDVHQVLKNSNIRVEDIQGSSSREWFKINLEIAKKAIKAVKENKKNLSGTEIINEKDKIIFRPEQIEAIKQTVECFKKKNGKMLWNAKMRFGKTLSALQVVKECKFKRTIIITHRPVVDSGWYEDFNKIFSVKDKYEYCSKNKEKDNTIEELLQRSKHFVYFASIQDLRGSKRVGGKFDKNSTIFATNWDFVIVDEAHEGTTTALGDEVIKQIVKEKNSYDTKFLALSGTPFNILADYEDENVYTWDYVMEQQSKYAWSENHFGDSNPYEGLPEMRMYTYDLGELLHKSKNYIETEDKAFNFKEFFRTWTGNEDRDFKTMPLGTKIGDFVHVDDVKSFLNLITKEDENSNYPFANAKYREFFKHTLWMVPGVKEAKALSYLMKEHPIFGSNAFTIVNVAGDGDNDEEDRDELERVKNAIKEAEKNGGYTITLSCGKLTTGVTIKEWTAVMMLAGSFSTSASSYLQTIFRVQSPCNINGKIKTCCYVFDFAPDRTLKMVTEAVAISAKAGKQSTSDRKILGEFLNYCPVIAVNGTRMKPYNTNKLLEQLKRAYVERTVKNGFDDKCLFNIDEILKLNKADFEEFDKLSKLVEAAKSTLSRDIKINNQGLTDEEYVEYEQLKTKKSITPEEEEKRNQYEEFMEKRQDVLRTLRSLSVRMPLLIYGIDMDINEDITMDTLIKEVDESSWKEFLPQGVSKDIFEKLIKFFDMDIFVAAGRKIRETTKEADDSSPIERVKKISELFSYFKNPDKETVLTPWRVVNMHMSDCIGGYDFFDKEHKLLLDEPRFVNQGDVTTNIFNNDKVKILEMNSKTGLYPLYVTYSIYKYKLKKREKETNYVSFDEKNKLWMDTVKNNVFVICKTPMAKYITKRTLLGYRNGKWNAHYFEDIISYMKNKSKQFISMVNVGSYWDKKGKTMKFNAIVGNPPYQENIGVKKGNKSLSKQLFPIFIENAILLDSRYVSFITPSRWFTGEAQDKSFVRLREFLKGNLHFVKLVNYIDNKSLFPGVEIAGGVNYFLYDKLYNGNVEFMECNSHETNTVKRALFEKNIDIVIAKNELVDILYKVKKSKTFSSITKITFGRNAFAVVGKESELNSITQEMPFDKSVAVRCAKEKFRYINRNLLKKNIFLVDKWKVFTSKANGGAGFINDEKPVTILGKAYIGKPNQICSDSLIPLGPFDTKIEAFNLQKYMTGKFFRFMVGILKVSQNIYQNVYQFVPMQNFTDSSDIDWNKSIPEIDKQLYAKYNLTDEEINYIESKIKPMK